VEQAWKAGIVVVVAAGNDGNSTTALTNPATDPFVVAVGASSTRGTTGTADDELASFTNLSTSRSPDVLAPGDGIVSLRDQGSNIDETYPTARVGETLFRGSGTSQTAPVVSAAVALLLQNRPSLTPDQVKRLLIDTGTPIRVGIGATKGLKEIDVGAAVAKSTPGTSQTWTASKGAGSIEAARGDVHVVRDNVALTGDKSIFGPFSSTTWAAKAAQRTAWSGGAWMGNRMAGDSWTGQWAGPSGSVATGQISGLNGWCVDVENGSDISGSQIQLYPCNNTPAQYVTLQPDSTLQVMGKCVNVKNNATANGSMLVLWDCDGRSSEKWAVNADRELKNPTSSRCIDASSTSKTSTNGTPLQIRDCNKTTAQRWMPPFASKTWGAATWTGKPWSGAGSWVDPSWSGTYWTGRYWSGRFWSGRYWSGRYWSSGGWSAARWG
jgi:serine protease AprX